MTTNRSVSPVRPSDRVELLDVMRGVAVCGMLTTNILVMGTVGKTQGRAFPAGWDADWIAWAVQRALFDSIARGLFTILFGAGMLMMLRKAEGPDAQIAPIDVWSRRCLALLFLGVLNFALLMWPAEILWTYGCAGLALLAFRTAKVRTLWVWSLAIIACLSLHGGYEASNRVATFQTALQGERAIEAGREPTKEQRVALEAAAAARASPYPGDETLSAEIRQRTGFPGVFIWSAKEWSSRHLGLGGWITLAESFAFMLAGMALYRSGVLVGLATARTYWSLLLLGGGIGLGLRIADLAWQARTGFELDIHRINPAMSLLRSAWYQPARLALTLGCLGLIALLLRAGVRAWTPPFRAMGRLALTNYTLQSALGAVLFYALGYVGYFGAAGLMGIAAGICIVTAVFSLLWLRRFANGPLELLLRKAIDRSFSVGRRRQAAEAIERSPPV